MYGSNVWNKKANVKQIADRYSVLEMLAFFHPKKGLYNENYVSAFKKTHSVRVREVKEKKNKKRIEFVH